MESAGVPASLQPCGRCCTHLHSPLPGDVQPLTHITLFETRSRFFLVGRTRHRTQYRVLKIDRYIPQTLAAQRAAAAAAAAATSSAAPDDQQQQDHQDQQNQDQDQEQGTGTEEWDGLPPVTEDPRVYTRAEILKLFGAYPVAAIGVALLGFVRLLAGHYIVLATQRRRVGAIAGHPVYAVDGARYVPVVDPRLPPPPPRSEARYRAILEQVDLTHDFYFSYGYNLTRSLQYNMTACRCCTHGHEHGHEHGNEHGHSHGQKDGKKGERGERSTQEQQQQQQQGENRNEFGEEVDDEFMWNTHFVRPMVELGLSRCWVTPLVHGFFASEIVALHGQRVVLTLVARRSRYSAGARFLKRGVLSDGHVANDVEVEQIVVREDYGALRPCMSSFVQVRGSIPLFWSQDPRNYAPKPAIHVDKIDPFYDATLRHFQDLFERYGTPVMVLNLIKTDEKVPREGLLAGWFRDAVDFANKRLPPEHRVQYVAWDLSRAMKTSRDSSYLNTLMQLVMDSVSRTGFFCSRPRFGSSTNGSCSVNGSCGNGDGNCTSTSEDGTNNSDCNGTSSDQPHCCSCGSIVQNWQSGVLRTNCIDSLDRTNAAQFSAGRCALALQLAHLGVVAPVAATRQQRLAATNDDVLKLFLTMYERMGNTIAVQYGGSGLANTMDTYSGSSSLFSQGRDLMASVQRYYRNSFTDAEKQQAINLFLGVYVPSEMHWATPLWVLESDYHLHNPRPELSAFVPLSAANLSLVPRRTREALSRHLLCTTHWWRRPLQAFHRVHPASADRALRLRAAGTTTTAVASTSSSNNSGSVVVVQPCAFHCRYSDHFAWWYKPGVVTFFDQVFQLHNMAAVTFDFVPPTPRQLRPRTPQIPAPKQGGSPLRSTRSSHSSGGGASGRSGITTTTTTTSKNSLSNNTPSTNTTVSVNGPGHEDTAGIAHLSASAVMLLNPSATRCEPGATFNKTLYHMGAAALHDAVPTDARPLVRVHDRDTVLYSQYGVVAAARASTSAPTAPPDPSFFDSLAVGKVFSLKKSSSATTGTTTTTTVQQQQQQVGNRNSGGTPRGRGKRRRQQGNSNHNNGVYQVAPLAESACPYAEFGVAVGVCADVALQRHYVRAAATVGAGTEAAARAAPYVAYLDALPRLLHGAPPFPGDRTAAHTAPPSTAALLHPPCALAAAYAQGLHAAPVAPAWLVRGAALTDPSRVVLPPAPSTGNVARPF